ncbi:MAG: HIT domain-containing protein [Rickettsiales bacterium]|jgi:diadenosine tetraphosphate (Ap4A) HIT family hydrolase
MPKILHPQLAKECLPIVSLGVCRVYLQNNNNFPWLILVPMRNAVQEIFDLSNEDYEQMMSEVRSVTKHFAIFTGADKMNVATLGNVVPQLHIHIIARFKSDAAWPNPVWNSNLPSVPYSQRNAELLIQELRAIF